MDTGTVYGPQRPFYVRLGAGSGFWLMEYLCRLAKTGAIDWRTAPEVPMEEENPDEGK